MELGPTKTLALLSGLVDVDFGRNNVPKLNEQMVQICVPKVLCGEMLSNLTQYSSSVIFNILAQ